ncbi:MAG: PHP domain-containing protein [Dethiobacteria bacterium]
MFKKGTDYRMYIWGDFHTHTNFSHGKSTVFENAAWAVQRGLCALAITDHGPASYWVGIGSVEKLRSIRREVERARRLFPGLTVYLGVEANIIDRDGTIDIPDSALKELDLLLVGLHPRIRPRSWRSGLHLLLKNPFSRYRLSSRSKARLWNTEALLSAIERYPVDIITHPGYGFSVDTEALAKSAANAGTLLEVNAGHLKRTWRYVLKAARAGGVFVINSDAHRAERVGALNEAWRLARDLGLDERRIFNVAATGEEIRRRNAMIAARCRRKDSGKRILLGDIMPKN